MVNWSKRADYIWSEHQTTTMQADQALADPDRVVLDPHPASRSGVSVRTIGCSAARGALVTVITVEEDNIVYGVNAWGSNPTDRRRYRRKEYTMSKLDKALAEADDIEAAERTADPDAPLPAHVKVSHPGRARSKVLQVRLNPDEMATLEAIAERRNLPVSTVAREQILRLLDADAAESDPVSALVVTADRLKEYAMEVRRKLGPGITHGADGRRTQK